MRHHENTWESKSGLNIYSQGWKPDSQLPKAIVCLVHGLGEHSGRYEHVAKYLTEGGFTLLGLDLRGHGRSEGLRGHIDSIDDYLEDIDGILNEAQAQHPGKPRFLYGHSMGGLLVLNHAIKRQPDLAGVIATGAALHTTLEEQALKLWLANSMSAILPRLKLKSGLVQKDLSHDPEVLKEYKEDPLVHDWGTLSMAKEMAKTIQWTREHASEFRLPLLLMNGSDDRIVYPASCEEFASKVYCDCTVKMWDGLYHEIHNEPEKAQVMQELVAWLESKC